MGYSEQYQSCEDKINQEKLNEALIKKVKNLTNSKIVCENIIYSTNSKIENLEIENQELKEIVNGLEVQNRQLSYSEDEAQNYAKKMKASFWEKEGHINDLEKENQKLEEALAFYADKSSWNNNMIKNDNELHFFPSCESKSFGGKLARKTLEEIKEK